MAEHQSVLQSAGDPMKSDIVRTLTTTFEGHAQQTDAGSSTGWRGTYSICWATPNGAISRPSFRRPRPRARSRGTR
jgi:hypothetical protein